MIDWYWLTVCICTCVYTGMFPTVAHTEVRGYILPPTTWVLGIILGSAGLVAHTFTCWAMSPAQNILVNVNSYPPVYPHPHWARLRQQPIFLSVLDICVNKSTCDLLWLETHLKSIHVTSELSSPLLFIAECYFTVWTYHNLAHLVFFFLPLSNAAVSIHIQIFKKCILLEIELLVCDNSLFNFLRDCKLFSMVTASLHPVIHIMNVPLSPCLYQPLLLSVVLVHSLIWF